MCKKFACKFSQKPWVWASLFCFSDRKSIVSLASWAAAPERAILRCSLQPCCLSQQFLPSSCKLPRLRTWHSANVKQNTKRKGVKKREKKKKRRKEKINNKRERNKKEKERRKIKALQASGFNLFGFFHYLFTCFFPPLIIPLQSSQTCWTSMLVAQEQSWAVMLCSEYV